MDRNSPPRIHLRETRPAGRRAPPERGTTSDRPGELATAERRLIDVAVLAALGEQAAPRLRRYVAAARRDGASREAIAGAIWRVGLHAGLPAAVESLHAALDVFDAEPGGHVPPEPAMLRSRRDDREGT